MARVTYNSQAIGDWAWAEITYEGNPETRIIPRAKGVKIYSTTEIGGGFQTIVIHAYLLKDNRKEIEDYFGTIHTVLGSGPSTLVVDGTSYTNTYLVRVTPDEAYEKFSTFSIEFIRSI